MRDFLYNKGDVLIAILVILVAAVVIYLRVGVVMDYDPLGLRNDASPAQAEQTPEEDQPPPPFAVEEDQNEGPGSQNEDHEEHAGQTGQTGQADQVDPPQEDASPQNEDPPAPLSQTMQITVDSGDAASTIADKLYDAGAISDKQAFLSDVAAKGADSKLKQGTFTIPEGSSHADIITILTM